MNKNIKVYTLSNCGYCKTVKEFLTSNSVEFEECPTVDFKGEWEDITFTTGMASTPTVIVDGTILIPARDFGSPDHLLSLINSDLDIPILEVTSERLKTLNYNINVAFGRVATLLQSIETKLNENGD